MEPPTFRGKPSEAHVLWRREGSGATATKRFDEAALRAWCSRHSVDFETTRRVDHERSDRPRTQYRVTFAWTESAGESFDLGGDEWEIRTGKTPATFLEIDGAGQARLKTWSGERILDLRELVVDGPTLVVRAEGLDGRTRIDARTLRSESG